MAGFNPVGMEIRNTTLLLPNPSSPRTTIHPLPSREHRTATISFKRSKGHLVLPLEFIINLKVLCLRCSSDPNYDPTPLYSWQAPPSHHQEGEDQEGSPRESPEQEPRGRKRHQRSHGTRVRSEERPRSEPHRSLGPLKPKQGFLQATSRLRRDRPPPDGFTRSAKSASRNLFLPSPRPVRSRKLDLDKYRYDGHDRSGTANPRRGQEHTPVSTPAPPPAGATGTRPTSQGDEQNLSHQNGQASYPTCPETPNHRHRAQSHNHGTQLVSLTQTSPTRNTTGDRPCSRSDSANFNENLEIPRMNGLLDIWDSTGNPNWEKETFALCDLEHCCRCGKYFVLMRTVRHGCRK